METCLPGAWVGGRRPGSSVDTPKLSGAPSLCPATDGLSAGSTMVTDATVRGSRACTSGLEEDGKNSFRFLKFGVAVLVPLCDSVQSVIFGIFGALNT